jgi:hypothetical protein
MRVVALCNKLTRSKGSKLGEETTGGGSGTASPVPPSEGAVSNMKTGEQVDTEVK